jgi:hypothetical protein
MNPKMPESGPTTLRALLQEAAAGLNGELPPPALRERVLAAQAAARPSAMRRWRWALPVVTTVAVVVMGLQLWTAPPPAARPAASSPAFIALAGDERLRQAAREGGQAWIVRTELPRERLAAMGLPYDPAHAGDRVRTELLMDRAGAVLAVRVLQ